MAFRPSSNQRLCRRGVPRNASATHGLSLSNSSRCSAVARFRATASHDKIVDILLSYGNYRRDNPGLALIALATIGKKRDVATLIIQGADIHAEDDLALRRAAWRGHMLIAALILGNFNNTELRTILATAKEPNLLQAVEEVRQKRVRKAVREYFRSIPEMEI